MFRYIASVLALCLIASINFADEKASSRESVPQSEASSELINWWRGQVIQPEVYWRSFPFNSSEWSATGGAATSKGDNDWVNLTGIDGESKIQWDMHVGFPYMRALRVEFETDPESREVFTSPVLVDFRVSVKRAQKDADFVTVPFAMAVASSFGNRVVSAFDGNPETVWPIEGQRPQITFEFGQPIRFEQDQAIVRIETTVRKLAPAAKLQRMRISSTFHIDPHRLVPVPEGVLAVIQNSTANTHDDQLKVQTFFDKHILPEARFQKWRTANEAVRPRNIPPQGTGRTTGTLSGRFEYDGEIPQPKRIEIPNMRQTLRGKTFDNPDSERFSKLELMDESLVVGPQRGLKNVFIWIRDRNVPIPAVPDFAESPQPLSIAFKNGRLEPHASALWVSYQALKLSNEEDIFTNLRWDPNNGTRFNLSMPSKHSVVQQIKLSSRKTNWTSMPTSIVSDVHSWMSRAVLLACDHPYFAITDEEGRFTIKDLPVGEWEFAIWHERAGWVKTSRWPHGRFKLTIIAGDIDLGTSKVPPSLFERNRTGVATAQAPKQGEPVEKVIAFPSREERLKANNRDEVKEFTGNWTLKLPRGFEYSVTLRQTEDGLMEMDCPTKITLLGKFTMTRDRQMFLIEPADSGIDDFIWKLNDKGEFVLIHESHRVGATYLGATLRR